MRIFIHAWTKKSTMHSLAYQTRIQKFTLMTFYQWVTSWGSIVNMMIKGWWRRRFGPFRPLFLYTGETRTLLKKVVLLAKLTRELGFFGRSLRMSTIKSRWLLIILFLILLLLLFPFFFFLSTWILTIEIWSSEEEERDEATTGEEGVGLGWGRSSPGGEVTFETLGVTGITRLSS